MSAAIPACQRAAPAHLPRPHLDAALRDRILTGQKLVKRQWHQPLCIRDLFVDTGDLGAVGLAGLSTVLRRLLARSALSCDSIHADMAAELALVSSGMTIPLSRAIFSANNICAGLAGPGSPGDSLLAFLGACWSRNARQIDRDFV